MGGEPLLPGPPDGHKNLPPGSYPRHRIEGRGDASLLKPANIELSRDLSAEIMLRAQGGEGSSIGELKDLISRRLNPDKLVESAFKQAENSWQTLFAWNTAQPSSFLKDFRIEERAHRPDKDESREYQITIEFNFKKVGQVKTILFWMDNVLSCRMICRDPASYALLQSSKEQLRERLKKSDIPINSLKIEPAKG